MFCWWEETLGRMFNVLGETIDLKAAHLGEDVRRDRYSPLLASVF